MDNEASMACELHLASSSHNLRCPHSSSHDQRRLHSFLAQNRQKEAQDLCRLSSSTSYAGRDWARPSTPSSPLSFVVSAAAMRPQDSGLERDWELYSVEHAEAQNTGVSTDESTSVSYQNDIASSCYTTPPPASHKRKRVLCPPPPPRKSSASQRFPPQPQRTFFCTPEIELFFSSNSTAS
ncbi:hypothetical protein KP509_16G033300 [Ceratopteris richardii]|uniref:Uncharacterized protein n=1 Tax=Ceratopteris richardii TaxID=49495 RepID=A0A8T2T1Z0_CERRI|nr:hypothetical protein KP509_16G033300 [Ceratopteris richardii]